MSIVVKRVSATMELGPTPPPRRHKEHHAPLALPEFDDSSDSENDAPAAQEQHENDENEDIQGSFQGEFKWDGVNEIQQLKQHNSELLASIKTQKQQIAELQLLLEAVEPLPGVDVEAFRDILQGSEVVDHDIRDVKIVHQAKKIRQVTLAYNKEKNRAAAVTTKMTELEKAVEVAQHAQLKAERALQKQLLNEPKKISTDEKEISASMAKKFEELKAKVDSQTFELKKTQRALLREVGDDVSLSEIIESNESGKRGRAQQIVMLKAKIKKLERAAADSSNNQETTKTKDVDQKAQEELLAAKQERQKQLDKLTAEFSNHKDMYEKLRKKYDATKARLQVFEKDASKNKLKINVLLDKSKNDDTLIDRLQRELEDVLANKKGPVTRARTADSKSPDAEELESLRSQCKDQKRQLSHQASMIESFQRDLEMAQHNDIKHVKAGLTKEQFANYQALAIEKERLVELVKSLQQQLQAKDNIPKVSSIPVLRHDNSQKHLSSPRSSESVELTKLKRALEAKDEEIATWKHAYETALAEKVTHSFGYHLKSSKATQHPHLIADLEEENAALKSECQKLQAMVKAARKREEAKS
ncbi:hypothetical protein THRCLA_06467 [Thraustotheca clavata]|uniref:Uncharacterized protein n=1 Tax=Thraustotheca clavata TaxID=74557 RepID=A0A1V9ZNI5_9STRA|nr:hypothetical protein THRCLA_06467 [Thraustotheca clavata]